MAKYAPTGPNGDRSNYLGPSLLVIGSNFLLPIFFAIPLLLLSIGQLGRADVSRAVAS